MTPNGDGDRAHLARATLLIMGSAACFSTLAIFVSLALRAGAPLLTILSGRFVFGAAALSILAGRRAFRASPDLRRALVVRAGFLQAAVVFTSGFSLKWLPAATLVFLFYTYPAWVTLIAALTGRERVTMRRALALMLSLAGVTVMVGAPGPNAVHPGGAAFALASALIFAIYLLYTDRLQVSIPPVVTSFWIAIGAGLWFLVTAALSRELTVAVAPQVWLHMLGLGLIGTALGYGLFFAGLRQLGPVRTAIISTVEPFWSSLFGWLILAQHVTLATAIGGACIATAVILLQLPTRKRQLKPAAT
ncbi:MAG TPA: DMT family transporter [Gemmatimonadaceae bacterium]|nr:DMT family transporter [Gemmatimonadaceae bacterium]